MSSADAQSGVNIKVVCRCRPLNPGEAASDATVECNGALREINVVHRQRQVSKRYSFDRVYGPASSQFQVYKEVAAPIVEEVLAGFNCTIFAYGQTGTGKTYTMEGVPGTEQAGIIPRTVVHIFQALQQSGVDFTVRVSHLELYNEEINDLLASPSSSGGEPPRPIRIFDDHFKAKGVCLQGAEEVPVRDANEILRVLEKSTARRKTAATLLNPNSSRSHCVFTVSVLTKELSPDGEELIKVGKLNLVDLAGSENMSKAGTCKDDRRKKEASNINQSLLTLGRVIDALCQHQPYVPYRDSKLTRLLQESLGGRAKTIIVATISPAVTSLEETLGTLDYAYRARNIRNRPELNMRVTKRAMLREKEGELTRLRDELRAQREHDGVFLDPSRLLAMETDLASQHQTITDLEAQLLQRQTELDQLTDLLRISEQREHETKRLAAETQSRLDETSSRLEETARWLEDAKKTVAEREVTIAQKERTERELREAAMQLISEYRAAIGHVEALHAKLERVAKAEEENRRRADDFRRSVKARLEDVSQRVSAFSSSHTEAAQSLRDGVAGFVSARLGGLATTEAAARSLAATLSAHASEAATAEETPLRDTHSAVDALGALQPEHARATAAVLADAAASAQEIAASLHKAATEHTAHETEIAKQLTASADTLVRDANARTAEVVRISDALAKDAAECSSSHAALAAASKAAFDSLEAKQREIAAATREAVARAVAEQLDAFDAMQREELRRAKDAMAAAATSQRSAVDTLSSAVGKTTRSVAHQICEAGCKLVVDTCTGLQRGIGELHSSAETFATNAVRATEASRETWATAASTLGEAETAHSTAVADGVARVHDAVDATAAARRKCCESHAETACSASLAIADSSAASASECKSETTQQLVEAATSLGQSGNAAVFALEEDMEHTNEEAQGTLVYRGAAPTGETPAKRKFPQDSCRPFLRPSQETLASMRTNLAAQLMEAEQSSASAPPQTAALPPLPSALPQPTLVAPPSKRPSTTQQRAQQRK